MMMASDDCDDDGDDDDDEHAVEGAAATTTAAQTRRKGHHRQQPTAAADPMCRRRRVSLRQHTSLGVPHLWITRNWNRPTWLMYWFSSTRERAFTGAAAAPAPPLTRFVLGSRCPGGLPTIAKCAASYWARCFASTRARRSASLLVAAAATSQQQA